MKYFNIMIQGASAVSAGYKFQGGRCCRDICINGRPAGLLEVVIDDPGTYYNGIESLWVSVSNIKTGRDVAALLDVLSGMGFSGCPAEIEVAELHGCCEKSEGMCCVII